MATTSNNASAMDSLDPPVNENVQDDKLNKAVQNALKVIWDNYEIKNQRDAWNRNIQALFEQGFEIRNPRGTKKINSKKLFQAIWRMASRMKPLDFAIHGNNRPREIEKIVTDGVSTVMTEGGYISALRDKGGAFFNSLMYGDAFINVGSNPEDAFPIVFNPISNTNVYVDEYATGVRAKGWGRNATKLVAIFSYSWGEFVNMFPEMKKKAGLGRIPRGEDTQREIERDRSKRGRMEKDLIEVAYAYDIRNDNYVVFAGAACTVIKELKGDDYPFIMEKKPYIPVLHYMCYPSSEGFYNYGIGNMIYDLAILSRRMLNMEIGHIEDNTYPIELVSVAQGEASKFFNKLQMAHKMRATGKKGYVAMEYDPNNPGSSAVQSQSLLTENLFNEWNAVFDRLDRELARMGIMLDEADRGANVTATQILAEEESQNAFIKQIQEYNASESKFAVSLTLDMIRDFVKKNDKTPLNLSTVIPTAAGDVRADGVTLGMVSEEVKQHHYWTRINARSGAIPSNVLRSAQISRGLSLAQPGSPASVKLMGQFAKLHDLDMPGEDFVIQASSTPVEPEAQPASETDRKTINPQKSEQEAIL